MKKLVNLVAGHRSVRDHLEANDVPIFTSDPANFLVAANILNKVRDSVSELKAMLGSCKPELEIVVERVLAQMTGAGIVDVIKDKIIVLRHTPYIDLKKIEHFEFIRNVMAIVARRVQKNYTEDLSVGNDDIAFLSLPDHPKVRRRILEITDQYLHALDELEREVQDDPSLVAERVRFCLVMTGNLEPEDF